MKSKLKQGVFLSYPTIKKGLEKDSKDGYDFVQVRSTSISNMLKSDKPLIITVKGSKDLMILHPHSVSEQCIKITKNSFSSKSYKLHKFKWKPVTPFELSVFNSCYDHIRRMKEMIKDSIHASKN